MLYNLVCKIKKNLKLSMEWKECELFYHWIYISLNHLTLWLSLYNWKFLTISFIFVFQSSKKSKYSEEMLNLDFKRALEVKTFVICHLISTTIFYFFVIFHITLIRFYHLDSVTQQITVSDYKSRVWWK